MVEREHTRPRERRHRRAPVCRELLRAVAALGLRGRKVLVAASGGLDSTVLAHGLAAVARARELRLALGHVHHGLRGDDSDADQAAVVALADRLGVPCSVRRVDPRERRAGHTSRTRPTLQEAARELRYAALREMAFTLEADVIATAHHADDQAETVLLRLLRGTGPDGLGGIPVRSPDGIVVRPLLRVPRSELEAYAAGHELAWREDASNASSDYTRNRLRRRLPALAAEFNPRLLRALGDLAEAQQTDSEWIREVVAGEIGSRFRVEGPWLRIEAEGWAELPDALARRLAREVLSRCGASRDISRAHLERILAFLRTGRPGRVIELPRGIQMLRDREGFRVGPVREVRTVDPGGAC